MNPIYLFNDRQKGTIGIDAREFEEKFVQICIDHRETNRARVFAFILTDFHTMEANHFVLNDEFWNKLHTTSGDFLTVFHFDYKSKEVNRLFRTGKSDFVREQFDNFFDSLSKVFDTDEFHHIKMPAILFFQTNKAEILDFFCVELESKRLQENMNDLKDYIESAVDSVKKVTKENLENSNEIYNLLKSNIDSTKFKKIWTARIKKVVQLYKLIK